MRLTVDWSRTPTPDLWWFFREVGEHLARHIEYIAANDMTPEEIDRYTLILEDERGNAREIAAELRRRDERVDWEE